MRRVRLSARSWFGWPRAGAHLLGVAVALVAGCATAAAPVGPVNDRVHIFYYTWYGSPPFQRDYVHWQQGGHQPPQSIGANFYPQLGAYSSADPAVVRQHMAWIRQAGVGVVSATWWGIDSYEDQRMLLVLDAAAEAGLKVNVHMEPYEGRTPRSTIADLRYLLERYGSHPAFYRARGYGDRTMFYIYENLRHPAEEWRQAFEQLGPLRSQMLLIGQTLDLDLIVAGGFDGGYSYDGLLPFRTPRALRDWVEVVAPDFAAAGKLFIPSVCPGYWDDRAVPHGAQEPQSAITRDGGTGAGYLAQWRAAAEADAPFVTITSFNEWHEGSQIEPAVPHKGPDYEYPGYADGPMQYLDMTARAIAEHAPGPRHSR